MKRTTGIILTLCSAFVLSCGGGSDGDDSSNQDPTKTPAIKLNQTQSNQLESWKNKDIKGCSVHEIFDGKADEKQFVDMKVLLQKTNNKPYIQKDNALMVFQRAQQPYGSQSTSQENSVSINGKSSQLKVSSEREGENCKIFSDGQLIYETELAEQISVSVAETAAIEALPTTDSLAVDVNSDTGVARANVYLFSRLHKIVAEQNRIALAGEKTLGLSQETMITFFVPGSDFVEKTYSIPSTPSPQFLSSMFAPSSDVKALTEPFKNKIFSVFLGNQGIGFDKFKSSAEDFSLNFNFDSTPTEGNNHEYVLNSIQLDPTSTQDNAKAIQCFETRLNLMSDWAQNVNPFEPPFNNLADACAPLSENFKELMAQKGLVRDTILRSFDGFSGDVTRSLAGSFNGWDRALVAVVDNAIENPTTALQELDPGATRPVVSQLVESRLFLKSVEAKYPAVLAQSDFENILIGWTFTNHKVSNERIETILSSLDHSILTLPVSTGKLMDSLGNEPHSFDAELSYAKNLTAGFKSTVESIQTSLTNLGLEGNPYENKLNNAIQTKLSAADIQGWQSSLKALAEFKTSELKTQAGSNSSFLFDLAFDDFSERFMEQSWDEDTLNSASAIAKLNEFSITCGDTNGSISRLSACRDFDMISTDSDHLLDKKFNQRYGKLAEDLHPILTTLNKESLKPAWKYRDLFFDGLWLNCTDQEFSAKAAQFKTTLNKRAGETNFSEQIDLERELRDLEDDC